jgi:hypothetical protein
MILEVFRQHPNIAYRRPDRSFQISRGVSAISRGERHGLAVLGAQPRGWLDAGATVFGR